MKGRPTRSAVWLLAGVALAAVLAGGCGRKGAPLPPVIRVAERTRDLQVNQEGTQAVVTWGFPSMTRAGGPLPDIESVELWRVSLPKGQEPQGGSARDRAVRARIVTGKGRAIAVLAGASLDAATRGPRLEVRDDLVAWYRENRELMPLVVWYAVRTVCCGGRVSELSNIARLEPSLPPPPPTDLTAEAGARGITLGWAAAAGAPALVERSPDGVAWRRLTAEPVAEPPWTDGTAVQGRTWRYRLRSVSGLKLVGNPTDPITVAYPDVYPPPAPEDLVCLPEEGTVRLRWAAVSGAAAYRVFRQRRNGTWAHIAHRTTKIELMDEAPRRGTVTYAVKALDAAGNESEAALCSTAAGPAP